MSHPNGQAIRFRVLCIDDNYEVLQVEKSILEDAGFDVNLSNDPAAGLNLAGGGNVDLVVLDLEMPQMSGVELAQRLRAMRPTVPIIMVSASDLREETTGIVDSFVLKSQMATTLVVEVNRILRDAARWGCQVLG